MLHIKIFIISSKDNVTLSSILDGQDLSNFSFLDYNMWRDLERASLLIQICKKLLIFQGLTQHSHWDYFF